MATAQEHQMREAARAAAELVEPDMRVGLGTGRTVAFLLTALAERRLGGLRCVATSPETTQVATELGLSVEPFDAVDELDIAIDGADQVTADHWAVKGGHGAELREKIVAVAARRFVVIVSADKLVPALHPPVPLELRPFGLPATIRAIGNISLRTGAPPSPDGGVLADYQGPLNEPARLAARLDQHPGVAGHGLFSPAVVDDVIVGSSLP
jgi:ribose 5-phosphate isomerase A